MIVRLRKLTLLTALALSLNPLLPASALGFMEAYRAALQNDPTYQAAIAENEAGQQNRAMGRAGFALGLARRVIDAKGTKARYVRLWSNGNTSNDMNHYCEVQVYGTPAK